MVKTLVEKLNLNKFEQKLLWNCPDLTALSDLTDFILIDEAVSYDLVVTFVKSADEFVQTFSKYRNKIKNNGLYVVAYPKKGNKKFNTYIHRDELFGLLKADPDTGIVADSTFKFNRMVGLDETYTVVAVKNMGKSPQKKNSTTSQRVEDYKTRVSELCPLLTDSSALIFFEKLSPGYQRDWARYLFSAKTEATQEKRKTEFRSAMAAGIKTADLYKKMLKEGKINA